MRLSHVRHFFLFSPMGHTCEDSCHPSAPLFLSLQGLNEEISPLFDPSSLAKFWPSCDDLIEHQKNSLRFLWVIRSDGFGRTSWRANRKMFGQFSGPNSLPTALFWIQHSARNSYPNHCPWPCRARSHSHSFMFVNRVIADARVAS